MRRVVFALLLLPAWASAQAPAPKPTYDQLRAAFDQACADLAAMTKIEAAARATNAQLEAQIVELRKALDVPPPTLTAEHRWQAQASLLRVQLAQAEQRALVETFRAIVQAAPDAVFRWDRMAFDLIEPGGVR